MLSRNNSLFFQPNLNLLSRRVLQTAVRRSVGSRNLVNEEALAHWGAVAPEGKKKSESRRGLPTEAMIFVSNLKMIALTKREHDVN